MSIFPFEKAKALLVGYVQESVESELRGAAGTIVDLHIDPRNFAMPLHVDYLGLRAALPTQDTDLRQYITFEDTRSIQGICRVMVRTHLNRTGIGYVSRGDVDKTQARRVLGIFPPNFNPALLVNWGELLTAWINFGRVTGHALFNAVDIQSLENLANLGSDQRAEAMENENVHNNWAKIVFGVHSGLGYLNCRYGLDADRVWLRIDEASTSIQGVKLLMNEAAKNIEEYGKALAGSFFADLGGERFVKADVHVKDAIAAFLAMDPKQVTDDLAFDVLQGTAEHYGVTPRAIDKIMYLAGSANLYFVGPRPKRKQQLVQKNRFLGDLNHLRRG